jgi:hypothetical protein
MEKFNARSRRFRGQKQTRHVARLGGEWRGSAHHPARQSGGAAGPAEPGFDRAKARRAADGIIEARRGVTLGGLKIKDLVNEGRP